MRDHPMRIHREVNRDRLPQARRALAFILPHRRALALIMLLTLVTAALGALVNGVLMLIGLNLAREAAGGLSN